MIKPIRTKQDYNAALKRIYELMQMSLKKHSGEFEELEILSILVENYEAKKFPIELPDPIEAIKFRLEQSGLGTKDLVTILGSRSRVSEIMSKKRKLTIPMIRALHNNLQIPLEALIQVY